ncbi:hypothetical protein [Deinococcus sp. YIM 77859]|uniref:hypothetical protein n=1 Tax=Deinococcus sp. YIM 77859 TaxID=1540221 RepID=UPI001E371B24|nr:hypothetical protein [Deinococcus sp. YIM 77859]
MRPLKVMMALAVLATGGAGAERFGVQAGLSVGGGFGLHAGAYGRVAGFGPVQIEGRGTVDLQTGRQIEVGADALLSVNLLLLRPYAGVGLGVPLGGGGTGFHTTLGARFGLPGPFSGFAEGNFGTGKNVYRAGLLLRF